MKAHKKYAIMSAVGFTAFLLPKAALEVLCDADFKTAKKLYKVIYREDFEDSEDAGKREKPPA